MIDRRAFQARSCDIGEEDIFIMPGMVVYDPKGSHKVRVFDVTYRQDQDGPWPARIYQPEGQGPFPALLDVHGGTWTWDAE